MSAVSTESQPSSRAKPKFNYYPFWSPRFWHGMLISDWWRLLARNRFRVHPFRLPMAISITNFAMFNSAMAALQKACYGRKIEQAQIEQAPVFILGHWRSGTTHLHELIVNDERFAFATTYQCFAPLHFLLTEGFVTRAFWFLVPSRRPMDNMKLGWDRPQEDEFALQGMGLPSPYHRMAFPNHPPPHMNYLDMQGLTDEELARWREGLRTFVKSLTVRHQKPIVLKSPPHTGRVEAILGAFPDARFIHITREPYSLFASTMRVWQSLDEVQGLQIRNDVGREDYVFDAFDRMYGGFESQRHLIDSNRIVDVRYEDVVQDPVGQLESIYEKLDLGEFETMRPRLLQYLEQQKEYKVNKHSALSDEVKGEIRRRWAGYIEKYGYATDD